MKFESEIVKVNSAKMTPNGVTTLVIKTIELFGEAKVQLAGESNAYLMVKAMPTIQEELSKRDMDYIVCLPSKITVDDPNKPHPITMYQFHYSAQ